MLFETNRKLNLLGIFEAPIPFTLLKDKTMRNVYKNAMIHFIKGHFLGAPSVYQETYFPGIEGRMITGSQLVRLYKEIAELHGRNISKSHVSLNVHRFAKKYGKFEGFVETIVGRMPCKTSVYFFKEDSFNK